MKLEKINISRKDAFRLLENKVNRTNFQDPEEMKQYMEFAKLLRNKLKDEENGKE